MTENDLDTIARALRAKDASLPDECDNPDVYWRALAEAAAPVLADVLARKDAEIELLREERDHARAEHELQMELAADRINEAEAAANALDDANRLLHWLHAEAKQWWLNCCVYGAELMGQRNETRRNLATLVEASLGPVDYTQPPEAQTPWKHTEHARARANIVEMHRLLDLRQERLHEAADRERELREALSRSVEHSHATMVKLCVLLVLAGRAGVTLPAGDAEQDTP